MPALDGAARRRALSGKNGRGYALPFVAFGHGSGGGKEAGGRACRVPSALVVAVASESSDVGMPPPSPKRMTVCPPRVHPRARPGTPSPAAPLPHPLSAPCALRGVGAGWTWDGVQRFDWSFILIPCGVLVSLTRAGPFETEPSSRKRGTRRPWPSPHRRLSPHSRPPPSHTHTHSNAKRRRVLAKHLLGPLYPTTTRLTQNPPKGWRTSRRPCTHW